MLLYLYSDDIVQTERRVSCSPKTDVVFILKGKKWAKRVEIICFRETLTSYCTVSRKQDCPPEGPLSDFHVKSSFSSSLNPTALNIIQTAS